MKQTVPLSRQAPLPRSGEGSRDSSRFRAQIVGLSCLCDDSFHSAGGFDAGQALVETLIFVGEFLVVDAEQVQNRSLKITNMNGIFQDIVGKVVSLSVNHTAFDSASRHPEAETARMMVTPVVGWRELAL